MLSQYMLHFQLYWVDSGWVQDFPLVVGRVGCVSQLTGWVGSGHTKWTHGQLWIIVKLLQDIL